MSNEPQQAGKTYNVGDIENSIAAIGEGAQVIVNKALTAAEEARAQEQFEEEKLAEAVARHAERLRVQAQTKGAMGGNPFKSLLSYELADAPRFFGRAGICDRLASEVLCDDSRCRLVVLHGDAGVGKTSLIRAGLMPRLITEQHLPLLVRLSASGASLADTIKQTLMPDLSSVPKLAQAPLPEFLARVANLLPSGKKVYILLDQFESFFDQPADQQKAFIAELARCLTDDDPRDHWLISVRSTRLGHLSTFQPSVPQPFNNTLLLPTLTRAEAQAAITKSAALSGVAYDADLVAALLDDLGKEAVDPSRLQLVCASLVDRLAAGDKHLSLAIYQSVGCADGLLTEYLDSVLTRNLAVKDRDQAWRILTAFAERDGKPETEAELVALMRTYEVNEAETRRLIDLLESNRLLRRHEVQTVQVELISDSLVPRIQRWAETRAVTEQVRVEAARQVERIRASALRGLFGGGLGFALAYFITFVGQINNQSLLGYTTTLRILPGALAGLLMVLSVDVALASYHGPRRWMRWLVGALSGAGAFGLAVLFHAFFRQQGEGIFPLILAFMEGAAWGAITGLGSVWVLSDERPVWQTLVPTVLASGITLGVADMIGNAYDEASFVLVVIAGMIMSVSVLGAVLLARTNKGTDS